MAKRSRISTPRRTKRRRTSRRKRRTRITRNIVPDSHVVRLRFVFQTQLDAGADGVNSAVFRANSIFDPDFTGILGHQPLGHDQWAQFYDHYNVIGSKCSATFIATGTNSSTDASMVGILLKDSSATIPTPTTIMEQTGSGYAFMSGQDAIASKRIRKGYSAKRFFAIKDIADNRSLLGASFGSNPIEDAYFHVYSTAIFGGNPRPVNVNVTIEYLVQLTERKTLPQS